MKVYSACSGVCEGDSTFHGPKVPAVSIRPRGSGLSSTVANEIGRSLETSVIDRRCITNVRGTLCDSRGRMVNEALSAVRWEGYLLGLRRRFQLSQEAGLMLEGEKLLFLLLEACSVGVDEIFQLIHC